MILSARPATASNRRLVEAAAARRHECRIVDGTRLVADTERGLWLGDRNLVESPPAVVLPRVGNWRPASLLAALEVLVATGVATPNPPSAVRAGRDHWRTVQTLAAAGLPVPLTAAGAEPDEIAGRVARRLGFPVVVKQRRSRMGVGVIRCSSADHLDAVLDSLWRLGDEIIVQRWVDTGGVSERVFVVGGEVIASARFSAAAGEWRSNAARGGQVEATTPDTHRHAIAVRAADCLGLGVCGVDLLPAPDGPLICEVNPTPGFAAVERATGVDVAGAVVDHLVALG